MKKFLKKIISTLAIAGTIITASGCELEMSDIPTQPESSWVDNEVDNTGDEKHEVTPDTGVAEDAEKEETPDSGNTEEGEKEETPDSGNTEEGEKEETPDSGNTEEGEKEETPDSGNTEEVEKEETPDSGNTEDEEKEETPEVMEVAYSSSEYVQALRDAIGARSDYVYGLDWYQHDDVTRFEHKYGEKITITCTPSVSEIGVEIAQEASSTLFDIIKRVNDQYDYEFVEYDENNPADITFNSRSIAANGMIEFNESNRMGYEEHYISRGTVHINEDSINRAYQGEMAETYLKYTMIHEMMHILGFSDVYETENEVRDATTLLNNFTKNKFALQHITPNDYKNIISCYYKPSGDIEKDIETCKQLADEYTKRYYEAWAESKFENQTCPTKSIENGSYTFVRNVWVDKENFVKDEFTFCLVIKDNVYEFRVFDSDGNQREECSGAIRYMGVNDGETNIERAVAVMECMESFFVSEDIYTGGSIAKTGFLNAILYESEGQFIFTDALKTINDAKPQFEKENQDQAQG